MDIYSYIRSADVAAYCRSIGHTFNPIEMACIIERSENAITQKLTAFEQLIDEYSDMSFDESVIFSVRDGLHAYLRALIAYKNRQMSVFCKPISRECVFCLADCTIRELKGQSDGIEERLSRQEGDIPLSTLNVQHTKEFKRCYATMDELLQDVRRFWDNTTVPSIRVMKIVGHGKYMFADFDYEGNIRWISSSCAEKNPGELSNLYIVIPTPFRAGDIVMMRNCRTEERTPILLKRVPTELTVPYRSGEQPPPFSGFWDCAEYYTIEHGVLQDSKRCNVWVPMDLLYHADESVKNEYAFLWDLQAYLHTEHDAEKAENYIEALMRYTSALHTLRSCEKNDLTRAWNRHSKP